MKYLYYFLHNYVMTLIKKIAVLNGGRIPFQPSGTIYKKLSNIDLVNLAFNGILSKTEIDPKNIDNVLVGNVIQDVKTSNIARESALACGIPNKVPATTISQACISSSQCLHQGINEIILGQSNLILTGGVESFSDPPIKYSKKMRQWLFNLPKNSKKGPLSTIKYLSKLRPNYFKPDPPALTNYTTGELMGFASEKIAERFGISRKDQDLYTLRSHELAFDAHSKKFYDNEIFPYDNNIFENNIRSNLNLGQLEKLKPSFKKNGTHTPGNSSGLTDGSTACLISSCEKAKELDIKPSGYILDSVVVGTDPYEELLLGPSYAIPKILKRNNLKISDIGVFEIHEAFAGQILANLEAINNNNFCENVLGRSKIGEIPLDKLNLWGGSLAIGHPCIQILIFLAATNIRNVMTCINRLKHEKTIRSSRSMC